MAIRVVRLGTPRATDEGIRIGTVRRPPRGVPQAEYASRKYYVVWLPLLAPSPELMASGKEARTDAQWKDFVRAYVREMSVPDTGRVLDVLAALSHTSHFSLGCYCEDESRCHRSILRALLLERGAALL